MGAGIIVLAANVIVFEKKTKKDDGSLGSETETDTEAGRSTSEDKPPIMYQDMAMSMVKSDVAERGPLY